MFFNCFLRKLRDVENNSGRLTEKLDLSIDDHLINFIN